MRKTAPRADDTPGGKLDGWKALLPFVVVVAVALVFAPALRNEFVLWDDDLNITGNPWFRGFTPAHLHWMFSTLHGGHYQPLTWLTFALDDALWGLNPSGYHLTNIVLHAANAVLVYLLVCRLLERAWTRRPAPDFRVAAAAGALFFALHPLRVESVAWATERRDVLSACFYLLTVLAYLKMQAAGVSCSQRRAWYALALACFTLSLLAKAWGITFPVVLLALDVYPLRRLRWSEPLPKRIPAVVLWEKLPFAVVAMGAAATAWLGIGQVEGMRTLGQHGVAARVAQAGYGLFFYVWKTLVPVRLSPLYLLEPVLNPLAPGYVIPAVAVVGLTAVLIFYRQRYPWALSAWLIYALIVSPVLGLAQVGPQLVADRYTYLSCLPAAVLVAAAVQRFAAPRPLALAGVWLGLALLGAQTVAQCGIWHDSLALWNHALRLDPDNYFAYTNRGIAEEARGDPDAAVADYGAAMRLNPNHTTAYLNRGHVREVRGDLDGALADYDAALHTEPLQYAATAYFNRAYVRSLRGDLEGAIADYSAALRADPRNVKAVYNRGCIREQQGDRQGAAADFAQALELAPPGWEGRERIERSLAKLRGTSGAR